MNLAERIFLRDGASSTHAQRNRHGNPHRRCEQKVAPLPHPPAPETSIYILHGLVISATWIATSAGLSEKNPLVFRTDREAALPNQAPSADYTPNPAVRLHLSIR
jgi:hypothetical protein